MVLYDFKNIQEINTNEICNNIVDCPNGKRDEQEIICQGSPFARNISSTIFLYMAAILLLFAIVKKRGYFKCDKHVYDKQDIATYSSQLSHLRSLMVDKSGIEFKVIVFEISTHQPMERNV